MDSSVTKIIHEKHIDRIGEAHDLARIYQRIQIQHKLVRKCCMESRVIQITHEKHVDRLGEAHDLARIYQRIQIQHILVKTLYGQ